jgi:hypothetical protein
MTSPDAPPDPDLPMPASFEILQSLAAAKGMPLIRAYVQAGMPTSTYYRHLNGRFGMQLSTYNKVLAALSGGGGA